MTGAAKLTDDGGDSAHVVQVLDVERAGGCQAHDVGRGRAGFVPVVHGHGTTGGVSDGREVQHGVGRAAKGLVKRHAVAHGASVDDLACGDALLEQLHDLHTGVLCQADALGVDSGDGSVAGKRDAQGLGQAADGVGSEHARAAAAGGAGGVLEPVHLVLGHGAGGHLAHGIKEAVEVGLLATATAAGEHGAAGNQHGGDVKAAGGDEHAGDDLVAAGDEDHGVNLMALDGALDGVCDDFSAGEREAHALVVHGDAVADANGVYLQRSAAGHADAGLNRLGDLVQVDVAGDDLVLRRDNRHKRAFEFLVREAVGLEQASVWSAGQAPLYGIASKFHGHLSLPAQPIPCEKCDFR